MRTKHLLSLMLLCFLSVAPIRATPNNLPYTDKQFEMAVACIKHFEGWHGAKAWPYYLKANIIQRLIQPSL